MSGDHDLEAARALSTETRPDPLVSGDRFALALEDCATGRVPPNIALLRLCMAACGRDEVEAALKAAQASVRDNSPAKAQRLADALALWSENPQAFATVKAVLDGVEHGGSAPSPDQGVAHWADAFDRLAEASPEGGIALYALGNPDLLRAATDDVVQRLAEWGLLASDRHVLEIGCGIGRFVATLAPQVAEVIGLDISSGMIRHAERRCIGLSNAVLRVSSGRDLAGVPDESIDLVLAADVFPYLVQAGSGTAERHVAEAARVLRTGGHLAILNFSYRGDPGQDVAEVAALARQFGFAVGRSGTQDFTLWDAATFLLQKI
ncbi:class I SAM-dependent methyltransferase [Rubellimicrobium arenae]|uniref:class I SAM-dependent methyltransferase n=1 Tax=Rubellimicrobium arenae TaxID=2817372 RepID=UPI001B309AA0|nr:class I SAM-dependent methyltransferase [Rubellimicrobium arenae]